MELNIEPENYIPVIYKTELELSNFSSPILTLLITGAMFYAVRKSMSGMMGGRKGKGLFGVMESTAKLINSNDINVRFK